MASEVVVGGVANALQGPWPVCTRTCSALHCKCDDVDRCNEVMLDGTVD